MRAASLVDFIIETMFPTAGAFLSRLSGANKARVMSSTNRDFFPARINLIWFARFNLAEFGSGVHFVLQSISPEIREGSRSMARIAA